MWSLSVIPPAAESFSAAKPEAGARHLAILANNLVIHGIAMYCMVTFVFFLLAGMVQSKNLRHSPQTASGEEGKSTFAASPIQACSAGSCSTCIADG